jgi:hypothetical protein
MSEIKYCFKEEFLATKTCSPYFRKKSSLFIYGKYNYYIDNPRGKIFRHFKILYFQSNQPWYPAA